MLVFDVMYKTCQFQHNGSPPQNYKEKNQLKQMIREGNVLLNVFIEKYVINYAILQAVLLWNH